MKYDYKRGLLPEIGTLFGPSGEIGNEELRMETILQGSEHNGVIGSLESDCKCLAYLILRDSKSGEITKCTHITETQREHTDALKGMQLAEMTMYIAAACEKGVASYPHP